MDQSLFSIFWNAHKRLIVKKTSIDFVLKDKILLETSNHKTILYHYAANRIIGFTYNNIEYFYERDLQGNIVRIYRKDNLAIVAEYTYDAYGNHVVSNLSSKKKSATSRDRSY